MSRRSSSKRASKASSQSAPTGLARRFHALMQDDLGGTISFSALAYVKASLRMKAQDLGTFKAIKEAVGSGELAVELATQSVEAHPIEGILENNGMTPACASGCAFCCILTLDGNGGPITAYEAERMFDDLKALQGAPDGRRWHTDACAALDPETRMCRAYGTRPILCQATASADASVCEALAEGTTDQGTNARHAAAYMVHVAQALGQRSLGAETPTYSLARFTAAVVEGADLAQALKAARHMPEETQAITKDAIAAFAQATRSA